MRRLLALVAVPFFLAACSSSKDSTPTTPQSIALSLSASSASVAPGGTATATATLTRLGGYTGAVTLSAENLPTGVTSSFNPAQLTGATANTAISFIVASNATPGTFSITLRASGSGVTSVTSLYALTVSPAPTPTIALSLGSSTATAAQGASATVPITIVRGGGYTDAVALTAEGLPTGVTAAFAPASLGTGITASTLTLTVASTATAATTAITVRATGTGVAAQTATVSLTVTAANTPDYSLTAAPASLSILPGATGTSAVTITRSGGFAGNVTLALEGAPAGVSGVFAPNPATAGTSTLTITTTTAAVAGTYNLTIRGTATGQADRTTAVSLTVSPTPGITLAVGSATATAAVGASTTSTITIARLGGFAGDVALTVDTPPAGIAAVFAPATITAGSTTSSLSISVGNAVAAGTYTLTVRATGTGVTAQTATITLTVTAAQGYSMTATAVTAAQGATGTSTVTLVRTGGFAGAVNLTVSGLPAGVTPNFTPTPVTGTTSSLSLAVGSGVAAGTYSGTITGTVAGVANVTTTVALTVTTSGGGGGGAISYRFCDQVPTFFAFRNGSSGSWTAVQVGANNTFSFSISQGTGQIAYATANGSGGVDVQVQYLAASEFPAYAGNVCAANPATKTVTGTVAGLAAGNSATISLGSGTASPSANGAFTINKALDGTADLVATRLAINLTTFTFGIDKLIVRRGINPPAGGSIGPVIDFNASEAVAPASAVYTIANGNGENLTGLSIFSTANGGSASFVSFAQGLTTSVTLSGVPSTLTQAGDLHAAVVFASVTAGTTTTTRAIYQYNKDLAARTLSLGAAITAPTITTSGTSPYARIRSQGPWQADYPDAVTVGYAQGTGSTRTWTVTASRAYFGNGSATYDVDLPDLSGVSGFNNAWGLTAGVSTTYSFNIYGGFRGLTAITEGTSIKFGGRTATISP